MSHARQPQRLFEGQKALLAAVLVSLLVLRSLVALAALPCSARSADYGVGAAERANCAPIHAHETDSRHRFRHACDDCCRSCDFGDEDGSMIPSRRSTALSYPRLLFPAARATREVGAGPAGWANSWSSRAPPSFIV
jgi:hypothetical protein